ncbi:Ig-like domain-containing protein, partial [Pseudomonas sp. PAB10]|uniref:Ig-like domain-containing protein n=1 Tax=Pseudomonas sp. PAB10 TaxID=3233047 RepID=UPI003F95BF4C
INVLANDTDADDGHLFTLNSASAPASKGTASVVGNQLVFNPGSDFDHLAQGVVEHVTLSYQMQDEHGALSSSTVDVTITGTNDAPVAVADTAAGTENQTLTIDVLANDTDVDDGHAFTLVSASAPANQGGASVVGNQLQFNPGADFDHLAQGVVEHVTLTYQMQDEHGALSSSTVDVTITGTNDAPVAVADTAAGTENQTLTINVLTNDTDADDGHLFTLNSASAPANKGSASVVGNQLVFNPGSDFDHLAQGVVEHVTLSYQMQDEHGALSSSTVDVTITGTNDAPVAVADTAAGTENQTLTINVLANDTDVDDGHLFTLNSASAPANKGTASVVGNQLVFNPGADFDHLAQGVVEHVTLTYQMQDEHGALSSSTVDVTITGTNDGPVAVADVAAGTENQTLTINVLANDTDVDDGHLFTLNSASAPANKGTASVVGNQLVFNPGADFDHLAQGVVEHVTLSYQMQDQYGALSSSTVDVTVTGTNDAPVAVADTAAGTENQTLTINVLANDTDVDDGHAFTLNSASAPANKGSASVVGNQLLFNPGTDFDHLAQGVVEHVTLSYQMQDQYGALSSSTVDVTITGTNDAPVMTAGGSLSYTENQAATAINSVLTVTDVDSSNLTGATVSITSNFASGQDVLGFTNQNGISGSYNASTGVLTLSGTSSVANYQAALRSVTYSDTSDNPSTAPRTISFQVDDGSAANHASNVATTTVTVAATNDAPIVDLNGGSAGNDATANYPTGTSQLLIAPLATVTDVDSPNLSSMTVTLTNAMDSNNSNVREMLSLNASASTAATGLTVTGVASGTNNGIYTLTITGSASQATYQTILKGVQYTDTKTGSHNVTDRIVNVVTNDGAANSLLHTVTIHVAAPAGVAGEAINLALTDPTPDTSEVITYKVSGVPINWVLSAGTRNGDGSWTIQTSDPSALTVMTPSTYAGAMELTVTYGWTNADGSTSSHIVSDNVEAYAPGSPIFALSADDNLTASSGADLFVFAQPVGNNVIHSFDTAADKIDLIGFTGVTGFADLSIAHDANGNALISMGSGQTVTLKGVDAAGLSEANFQFDVDPLTTNTGTISIANGAIMPFGGSIHNSGTIELGSTGTETDLEILFRGATLTGGGHVLLSDSAHNVIFGGSADTVLTNVDNHISGAGQLGAGQMVLVNEGLIQADGLNSLVLDTGSHTIVNSGVLESTGMGGMTVTSAVDNSGHLWANGGDLRLLADVTGNGSATIDGDASLIFGGGAHASVAFHGEGAGTLIVEHAADASSLVGILGLESNDSLMFGDIAFGANTQLGYSANALGSGGLLTVDDGVHRAEMNLLGHYSAADFHVTDGGAAGTLVDYHGVSSGTLVGSMLADVVSGGDGNDILAGRGGEDILSGGAGADVFAYLSPNDGGDTILDYNFAEGDTLDLSALLKANFVSGSSQVSDFVQLAKSGSDITVKVDTDGAANGAHFTDVAVLANAGTAGTDLVRAWFGDADHTLKT